MNLSCNPYGSSLQLHCSFTGPLYPSFHIEWYLSAENLTSETRLSVGQNDYQITNNVIVTMGDVEKPVRSVSSILATGPISESHVNQCIQCQVEFDDLGVSVGGKNEHRLCFGSAENHTTIPTCGQELVVFNSSFCAAPEDFTIYPLPTLASYSSSQSLLPSPSLTTPSSRTTFNSAKSAFMPLISPSATTASPLTTVNSAMEISIEANVATTHVVSPTPTLSARANAVTVDVETTPNSQPDGQQAAVGLFVAIGICIVFILIIIILMYISQNGRGI